MADDDKQKQAAAQAKADEKQQQEVMSGRQYEEDSLGTTRLVGTDNDEETVDAASLTPGGGIVQAPQHWDDVEGRFTTAKLDPFADNEEAANDAQGTGPTTVREQTSTFAPKPQAGMRELDAKRAGRKG